MQSMSPKQFAAAVFLFELGSSPLFLLASDAGRDAWLSVFVAMVAGFSLLVGVTMTIYRREPGRSLVEILIAYLGRWLGGAVAIGYLSYFCYSSARNVREFGDLMISYMLPHTPLVLISLVFMFISGYAVIRGVEVLFRLAELLLPWIVFMYAILFVFLLFSRVFHVQQLQPILEDGASPMLAAALPGVVSFPFGDMTVFLMYWKHSQETKSTARATAAAYMSAGLFLTMTNAALIGVLGPMSAASVIPLLESTSLISFAERLDPFVLMLLFIGVYIKQTVYFMAAVLVLSQLTGWRQRTALLPVGAAIFFAALAFHSYMQQVWVGFRLNLKYHFPIFQIVIPIGLLVVMLLRNPKARPLGE